MSSAASRRRLSLADRLRNEWETQADGPASKLSEIFEDEIPPLDVFVSDAKYFNQQDMTLGPIQYDFVRHFEQVLHQDTYIAMVEEWGDAHIPVRFVNDLTAEWGKCYGCRERSRLPNRLWSGLQHPALSEESSGIL